MTNKIKIKYKIGQVVYYIADGYIERASIKSIFIDKNEEVLVGFDVPVFKYDADRDCSTYLISDTKCQDSVYPTRDSLIKSIKETEFYD